MLSAEADAPGPDCAREEAAGRGGDIRRRKRRPSSMLTSSESTPVKKLDRLATQTVFAVLDHLFKWTHRKRKLLSAKARPGADTVKATAADPEYVQVNVVAVTKNVISDQDQVQAIDQIRCLS